MCQSGFTVFLFTQILIMPCLDDIYEQEQYDIDEAIVHVPCSALLTYD